MSTLFTIGNNNHVYTNITFVRNNVLQNGKYKVEKELPGIGVCPYNPEHNNTVVQSNGQIFAATIADFSERDPVIYREPQRTELSDLKQLNGKTIIAFLY